MTITYRTNLPTLSARSFRWAKRVGTCDLSDLGPGGIDSVLSPLFEDACDVGLALMSPKTGVTKHFVHTRASYGQEGEVTSWNLVEMGPRGSLASDALQLVIYND